MNNYFFFKYVQQQFLRNKKKAIGAFIDRNNCCRVKEITTEFLRI